MAQAGFKIFGEIQKIDEEDDGTITVHGVASSECKDHSGETVKADAMREALPDYSRFPALREMHQPMAAGRVLEAEVDDLGVTHIAAKVVDPVAIVKVRTGVYSGFSIGGKVLKRDPNDRSIITSLRLVEISLVDSPCNPDAILSMWKADAMTTDFKPASADVIERAKILAKAQGHARFKDCLFEASQELISEHILAKGELEPPAEAAEPAATVTQGAAADGSPIEGEADKAAGAEADAIEGAEAPAAEAGEADAAAAEAASEGEQAAAGEGQAADEDEANPGAGDAGGEDPADKAAETDPAAALSAAIGKAREGSEAAASSGDADAPAGPFEDYAKAAAALRGMSLEGEDLQKGLYGVSRLADLLESLGYVASSAHYEAECEDDGSTVPAQLADAIRALGAALVEMAREEVGEMLAGLPGGCEVICCGDEIERAGEILDLVKADEALMAKIGERLAKAAPAEGEAGDEAEILKAENSRLEGEVERLGKALADAAPEIEAIAKRNEETIGGLRDEIAELRKRFEDEPLPARTAGPGATRLIAKGQDSEGGAGAGAPAGEGLVLEGEEFRKAWDGLSDAEKGEILVRAALRNPAAIAMPGGR